MKKPSFAKLAAIGAVFCIATAITSHAQTFTTLQSFVGSNGSYPLGSLIQGTDGNFYGTTEFGGYSPYCTAGCGTVFEVSRSGELTMVYSFFCSAPLMCPDGEYPATGVIQAANRNIYGTTLYAGTDGDGSIFEITPSGKFSTLYTFCPQSCAGNSQARLVQGVNGNLYGTTSNGGSDGEGSVFEITAVGILTTTYSFCSQTDCADGAGPNTLVMEPSGTFLGTTQFGGGSRGGGTIFAVAPTGKLTTLYRFLCPTNCPDGSGPNSILPGTDGNLYGTTAGENGTIFRLTPTGNLTTLYSFCSKTNCADGMSPSALIQGADGNLYGVTSKGGSAPDVDCPYGCGTVFQITTAGALTTLYTFCSQTSCDDGAFPPGLVQGTDGNFYGSTSSLGWDSYGTIFSLSMGLAPFIESNPTFGKTGYNINILGNNLTGTTGVTFNGAPATFTVVSDTYIKATVPIGATSGTIEVTSPSGTLNSNVAFRVLP